MLANEKGIAVCYVASEHDIILRMPLECMCLLLAKSSLELQQ